MDTSGFEKHCKLMHLNGCIVDRERAAKWPAAVLRVTMQPVQNQEQVPHVSGYSNILAL